MADKKRIIDCIYIRNDGNLSLNNTTASIIEDDRDYMPRYFSSALQKLKESHIIADLCGPYGKPMPRVLNIFRVEWGESNLKHDKRIAP